MVLREGSEPVGRMRERELCSPVREEPERGSGRARHVGAKATDCDRGPEGAQDASGVWKTARRYSLMRNWGDPPRRPTLGKGGGYKPKAKSRCVERESEGPIVATKVVKAAGARGPCFGRARTWG